jgi:hypothetical protein
VKSIDRELTDHAAGHLMIHWPSAREELPDGSMAAVLPIKSMQTDRVWLERDRVWVSLSGPDGLIHLELSFEAAHTLGAVITDALAMLISRRPAPGRN